MVQHREKTEETLVSRKRVQPFLTKLTTNSEQETLRSAGRMGRKLRPGDVVALKGEIGSGKTLFIKGLCQGLGVKDPDEVKSPTFVLLHIYKGKIPIYHFDLYRLEREEELDSLGFEEFLADTEAVSLIEWADRAPGRIPKDSLRIQIKITGPHSRQIVIARQHSKC